MTGFLGGRFWPELRVPRAPCSRVQAHWPVALWQEAEWQTHRLLRPRPRAAPRTGRTGRTRRLSLQGGRTWWSPPCPTACAPFPCPSTFVRNQPRDAVERGLKATPCRRTGFPSPSPCCCSNGGGKARAGGYRKRRQTGPVGQVRSTLAGIGVDPATVDRNIVSNYGPHRRPAAPHEGAPALPNAQLSVPARSGRSADGRAKS